MNKPKEHCGFVPFVCNSCDSLKLCHQIVTFARQGLTCAFTSSHVIHWLKWFNSILFFCGVNTALCGNGVVNTFFRLYCLGWIFPSNLLKVFWEIICQVEALMTCIPWHVGLGSLAVSTNYFGVCLSSFFSIFLTVKPKCFSKLDSKATKASTF